jgi:hypothetical protein
MPAKAGDHAVHDEGGFHRQQGGAGPGQGHGQDLDQFVGTVAQQDVVFRRDAEGRAQGLLHAGRLGIGIAVDGRVAQQRAQLPAQPVRQAIGVLHGVQLHHAGRVGDMVGGQGQDFGADELIGRHEVAVVSRQSFGGSAGKSAGR